MSPSQPSHAEVSPPLSAVTAFPERLALPLRALGAAGDAWLADLPGLLAGLEADWSITLGAALEGGQAAYVAEAVRHDGTPVVLKVLIPPGIDAVTPFRRELTALRLADGDPYVELIRHDELRQALLLERLGRPMASLGWPVFRQMDAMARTAARGWRAVAPDDRLPTGTEAARWHAGFIPSTWEDLARPGSEQAVDLAVRCAAAREAAFEPERAVLVHGDVHNLNVLQVDLADRIVGESLADEARMPAPLGASFRLVDPGGLISEPAHDLGVIQARGVSGWTHKLAAREPQQALAMVVRSCLHAGRLTGVDAEAIWQWAFCELVSTGLFVLRLGRHGEAETFLAVAGKLAAAAAAGRPDPADPVPVTGGRRPHRPPRAFSEVLPGRSAPAPGPAKLAPSSATPALSSAALPLGTAALPPRSATPAPDTAIVPPSTTTPAPSTATPPLSSATTAPSSATPPPIATLPPSTATPAPSTTTPAPGNATPPLSSATPPPIATLPPSATTPAPSTATPAPSSATLPPSATTPAPDTATPPPSTATHAPGTATPPPGSATPPPSATNAPPGRAMLLLMVGLPGAGKTTRARELAAAHRALRLTPDEWMIPLFGESAADRKRDVLEGRLLSVALQALRLGTSVVLDFGLWGRDERSALRWLAASVGAACQVVYLSVDKDVQRARVAQREASAPHTTYPITEAELDTWREQFQVPDAAELAGGDIPGPPPGWSGWLEWATDRWPSFADEDAPGQGDEVGRAANDRDRALRSGGDDDDVGDGRRPSTG